MALLPRGTLCPATEPRCVRRVRSYPRWLIPRASSGSSHVDEAVRRAGGQGDMGGIGWQEIAIVAAIVIAIAIVVKLRA